MLNLCECNILGLGIKCSVFLVTLQLELISPYTWDGCISKYKGAEKSMTIPNTLYVCICYMLANLAHCYISRLGWLVICLVSTLPQCINDSNKYVWRH